MPVNTWTCSPICNLWNLSKKQCIYTRWGSIMSKSCLFQWVDSLPLLFVHLSTVVREELMMWTEAALRTCPQHTLQCWYDYDDKLSDQAGQLNVGHLTSDPRVEGERSLPPNASTLLDSDTLQCIACFTFSPKNTLGVVLIVPVTRVLNVWGGWADKALQSCHLLGLIHTWGTLCLQRVNINISRCLPIDDDNLQSIALTWGNDNPWYWSEYYKLSD